MSSAKEIIFAECMKPGGFAELIRENQVDEDAFKRLVGAVKALTVDMRDQGEIDRLTIACLFELPWEVENTIGHYASQSAELGAKVSAMSEELRQEINELLWSGLESYYENL